MLRIANYYESRLGRNDGNPLYVTAALKRIQYYSDIAAGRPANDKLLSWFTEPDPHAEAIAKEIWEKHGESIDADHLYPTGDTNVFGLWDLNLHVDWGEDALIGLIPYEPIQTPKPFAYWASDTHIKTPNHDSYDYRLSVAKRADYVFCAQKAAIDRMKADGIENPIWLPHAVEPQAYPLQEVATKRYDVCFVGHVNSANRMQALDRLFREFPNFYYGQGLFNDVAKKFGESRICFNISMTDDINMRTFEIMSTGSLCLTNWIPTIEDLFQDGKHLVLYRSLDEMVEKARYYLDHDDEREAIARAGYEEVRAKHTINHRVKTILDNTILKKVPQLA
jgi:hypothetical protein